MMREPDSAFKNGFKFQVASFKFADNLKLETWNLELNSMGQHLAEFALVFSVVIAAIFGMQIYVKRGLQARYHTLMDGATAANRALRQYEPYYASSTSTVAQDGSTTIAYQPGGAVTRTEQQDAQTEEGVEQVGVSTRMGDVWQ